MYMSNLEIMILSSLLCNLKTQYVGDPSIGDQIDSSCKMATEKRTRRTSLAMLRGTGMLLPLVLLCSLSGAVRTVRGTGVPSFTCYMFEQFYDVNGTDATNIVATPPGLDVLAMVWGDIGVSEMPIRATPDPADPVIGNSSSVFLPQKTPLHFTVFKLITLSTDLYNGTIAVFSDLNMKKILDLVSTVDMPVGGGTGSFQNAVGYLTVSVVKGDAFSNLYKYDAYLSIPELTPLEFN
ncbi:hypothetical protein R1sor_005542 [Riccia sorocarpa]|uniref:Dirigent protein n=1 Tax=Riccia sorocarpa TaxID=122646 RepID=A0ABD3HLU8_9MARC